MNREELEQLLVKDFNLNNEQLNKLYIYNELLVEKSKVMNLTTITDLEGVYLKHFYDSLLLSKTIELSNQSLIDVGTGAGLPGIVLKICFPNLKITLLEPTLKRCNFLNEVIEKLELKDILVINDRAENYVKEARESFDIVTARAVSRLNMLVELLAPLTKVGGKVIAMKGLNATEEVEEANAGRKKLGLDKPKIYDLNLPIILDNRTIIVYNKGNITPVIYPRMYSKIKNNPL